MVQYSTALALIFIMGVAKKLRSNEHIISFSPATFSLVLDDTSSLYWDKISWLIDYNRTAVHIAQMLLMHEDSRSEL